MTGVKLVAFAGRVIRGPREKPKLEGPKAKRNVKVEMPRTALGRLWFAPPAATKSDKRERAKRQAIKNDPKHVAAARELRDRWLEKVNSDPSLLACGGKYDVSKALIAPAVEIAATVPLLEAA